MVYYCVTRWLLVKLQWIYVTFGSQITGDAIAGQDIFFRAKKRGKDLEAFFFAQENRMHQV